MTEIKLTLDDPELFAEQLKHAASHWDDGRATPIGQALHMAAYQIEEQLKSTAGEAPTEWGSVVRARVAGDRPLMLVTYVPAPDEVADAGERKYSWYSDRDSWHAWTDLRDVEVLRVGLGEGS